MKLSSFVPWKSHVYELEAELGIQGDDKNVKYVVYEDDRDGSWRIQAVGVAPGSFTSPQAAARGVARAEGRRTQ